MWGWMSYDPELDLVYYGVGNPSPYQRRTAGRATTSGPPASSRAIPATARWCGPTRSTAARQLGLRRRLHDDPGGHQDRRAECGRHWSPSTRTVSSTRSTARPASCSSAPPYVQVTWAKSIDLKTGRPVLDSTKQTGASKGNVKGVCPSLEGGVSPASPAAYSPTHGTVLHVDQ